MSGSRVANRHARRRRGVLDTVMLVTGELFITAGVLIGLFVVWQLWWTGVDASRVANEHKVVFEQQQVASPKKEGTKHYDDPPVPAAVGYGQTIGMLIVPKWYGLTNNNMPILEGVGEDVLDQAAAGHYPKTQQVGEIGNFAIAGHRRTYGNSFRRIDVLEAGDEVVVATKDTWYVYTVEKHEIVEPTATEVVAPVPGDPTAVPTERYMTLTTCHSLTMGEWGNDHRWIVHAKFSYWMPRSEGRPASILSDPEVN